MRSRRFLIGRALLMACAITVHAGAQSTDLPSGWFKGGRPAENYEIGTDAGTTRAGKASVFVRARIPGPGGFGTIMQVHRADEFRGKRVRLRGYIKAANVEDWAGFWLRVDPADLNGRPLAFENMADRPVRGSRDWGPHHIVLDVPDDAALLHYGLLLSGDGTVWASDVQVEVVARTVPLTTPSHCCSPHK